VTPLSARRSPNLTVASVAADGQSSRPGSRNAVCLCEWALSGNSLLAAQEAVAL